MTCVIKSYDNPGAQLLSRPSYYPGAGAANKRDRSVVLAINYHICSPNAAR